MVMKSPNERLQANAGANQQIGGYGGASMPSAAPFHSMVGQFEIAEKLKGASMNYLKNYVRNPSGNIPLYMVMAEIQRRVDGQRRAKMADAAAKERRPTVAQQVLDQAGMTQEEGIMSPVAAFEQAQANRQINARSGGLMQFNNGGLVVTDSMLERIKSVQQYLKKKKKIPNLLGEDEIKRNVRKAEIAADNAGLRGEDKAAYLALIERESGFHPKAESGTGSVGIGQITAKTAKGPGFGIKSIKPEDRFDIDKNLDFSSKYYKALIEKHGDRVEAAAAYNIGTGNMDRARAIAAVSGMDKMTTQPGLDVFKSGMYPEGAATDQYKKQTKDYIENIVENLPSYNQDATAMAQKELDQQQQNFMGRDFSFLRDFTPMGGPSQTKDATTMAQNELDRQQEQTAAPRVSQEELQGFYTARDRTGFPTFNPAIPQGESLLTDPNLSGTVGPPEPPIRLEDDISRRLRPYPPKRDPIFTFLPDGLPDLSKPRTKQTREQPTYGQSRTMTRGGVPKYPTPFESTYTVPILPSSNEDAPEESNGDAPEKSTVTTISPEPGKISFLDPNRNLGGGTDQSPTTTGEAGTSGLGTNYLTNLDAQIKKILSGDGSKRGDQFYKNAANVEKRAGKNNPFTELREMLKAQNVNRKEQNKFLNSLPFFSAALKAIKSDDPSVLGTLASAGEGFITSALQVKDKIAQADNAALQTQMLLSQAELAQQNKDLDREQALMLAARQADYQNKTLSMQSLLGVGQIAAQLELAKSKAIGTARTEAFKAEQDRKLVYLENRLENIDPMVARRLEEEGIKPGDKGYVEAFQRLRREMLRASGL